jgi:hypothetical protein
VIEPWAASNHKLAINIDGEFAIALDVLAGEEKDSVVHALVDELRAIARVLEALPPRPVTNVERDSDEVPA